MQIETTNVYDIHWTFESEYDATPRLSAYGLYRDAEGYLNTDTADGVLATYSFTDADCNWFVGDQKLDAISDLWVDEWYGSNEPMFLRQLPPGAIEWLNKLSKLSYEIEVA